MKYALVIIMTLLLSICFTVLLLSIFDYKVVQVLGYAVPSNNDLATQVTGATKLYGLLDVLSAIPPPGSLQATGYQITNVPPAPYSDKPYIAIVTPPSAIITPQTYFVPTAPSVIPYPNVSAYAVGPGTGSYANSGSTYGNQNTAIGSAYGTSGYVSSKNSYDYQEKVPSSSYGSATSSSTYQKPHTNPELIVTGPNPAYPSYPGSSYSNQLNYNVGNVYNPNPVRPSYTAVTLPYTNTPPSAITFIPAPGAVLTNADCNHYKCQNEYKSITGNGGKYTPAVLPGLASTFVGDTSEYVNDNHGQPPPIPFPPIPPPVQFGSGGYSSPPNVVLGAGAFGSGNGFPGPGFGQPFVGGFQGGFQSGFQGGLPGGLNSAPGLPPPALFRPPVGIPNGPNQGFGFGTGKPYQGGGTFPLITPDYSSPSYANNQYGNNQYGNNDYVSQQYGSDNYDRGSGVGLASGTPYNAYNGGVALAYNGYGGSYYDKGSDYRQSNLVSQSSDYNPPYPDRPLPPSLNVGYPAVATQNGFSGGPLGEGQLGGSLGAALAGLTTGDGLISPLAQQFPIVPNGLVNRQGSLADSQFQPISESDAVLALALNAILEDRARPQQRTTQQLVSDVLRSRIANLSAGTTQSSIPFRRESNAGLWRQFLTSAVAFVSKRLSDNA